MIAIKGMDMPQNCRDCPFCRKSWHKVYFEIDRIMSRSESIYCFINKVAEEGDYKDKEYGTSGSNDAFNAVMNAFYADSRKFDNCPLIELPDNPKESR